MKDKRKKQIYHFKDIRFLMNGIEDFLTELSFVTNTTPCIGNSLEI